MKKHHTEEQILRILKEAEQGKPLPDVLRTHGIASGIIDVGFPLKAGRELRVRLTADQWNEQPPSVALLRPDGSFATNEDLPAYGGTSHHYEVKGSSAGRLRFLPAQGLSLNPGPFRGAGQMILMLSRIF